MVSCLAWIWSSRTPISRLISSHLAGLTRGHRTWLGTQGWRSQLSRHVPASPGIAPPNRPRSSIRSLSRFLLSRTVGSRSGLGGGDLAGRSAFLEYLCSSKRLSQPSALRSLRWISGLLSSSVPMHLTPTQVLSQKSQRKYSLGLRNRDGISGRAVEVAGRLIGTKLSDPYVEW
jgi:hypothetical protein